MCCISSNVFLFWDQCKRPWEIVAGVLQSHQGKYLLEKVERWSYIRTWFDGSVDQKCWLLAPKKKHNFNDLWTKEVIYCLKKKWTQSADDLLGFCERLWDEFKRFEQPDHFWLQQTCKNYFPYFPEAWFVVYKRLPFSHDISIFSFSYIKSSLRVSHEKSHSCNSGLRWENMIKNCVEKTPSQPLFTWFFF